MSTQNIPNFRVCSLDKRQSKIINIDKSELHVFSTAVNKSKRVIVNSRSSDKSESKSVHIIINLNEVTYAKNETKDEEPSVTDNSFINAPSHFKLFECGKNLLKSLMPHLNKRAWKL